MHIFEEKPITITIKEGERKKECRSTGNRMPGNNQNWFRLQQFFLLFRFFYLNGNVTFFEALIPKILLVIPSNHLEPAAFLKLGRVSVLVEKKTDMKI